MRNYLRHIQEEDYRGEHRAPDKEYGAPMHDPTGIYGDDIYSPRAAHYYGGGDENDPQAVAIIQAAKDKPNHPVKMYRAVPAHGDKKKLKAFNDVLAYYDKHGFFPMKNKIASSIEDLIDKEFPSLSYDRKQESILSELKAQIRETEAEMKKGAITKINDGDWVAIVRKYAEDHGKSALNGKYKIISKTTKAKNLYTDSNSLQEWGYVASP